MRVIVPASEISWPLRCAACLGTATTTATTSCQISTGVPLPGIVVYKKREAAVAYPVCSRHRLSANLFGLLSRRSLFNLGLGLICTLCAVAFVFLLLADSNNSDTRESLPILFVPAAAYWAIFFIARRLTPVKLCDIRPSGATFFFSNPEYGRAFRAQNQRAESA